MKASGSVHLPSMNIFMWSCLLKAEKNILVIRLLERRRFLWEFHEKLRSTWMSQNPEVTSLAKSDCWAASQGSFLKRSKLINIFTFIFAHNPIHSHIEISQGMISQINDPKISNWSLKGKKDVHSLIAIWGSIKTYTEPVVTILCTSAN